MKTYHHVTPRENLKSIQQQGLIPRRGKRSAALGEEQDADDGVMTLVMPRKAGE